MLHRLLFLGLILTLAACSSDDGLLNIKQEPGEGPDEFAILPTKPLVLPEDVVSLPAPTPGGSNITDPTPEFDVASALGGNAAVLSRASNDGALVNYSTRFGIDPQIRAELAASDAEFRRNNRGLFLERLFDVNVYFRAYDFMSLDQYGELDRLRRAGVRTPAVPPEP
ncbi:DUF3035 domain-containing protein [Rhodobacteraceae bacterium]|nr:DUF3035 domain-containing protein [Paracoccaceae bacterium]